MLSSALSPSALLIPHGLTILTLAIKHPAHPKLVFAQILAFVAYNIHTETTVSPSTDWPLAFLTALVFAGSDFLLLTKSYANLHKKDQVVNIEEQPPLARIKWAMSLLPNQRMIGWTVEPDQGPTFPATSRQRF
ncbi:hypothetical protein BDN71DRAFT_1502987 [Pleurotus eryngii]|uniref:Uncharacterized protein n=1 Tax=Pleurotus eryngii TaxID=5323 RepID=A0A9P6A9N2_PLEER|nr:hypothetical protein BDN71DRAFT_1502987 [Pleurotus eryngii]